MIGVNYTVISKTNQMALINAFLLEKFFNISGNLMVHINLVSRFLYSNVIHVVAIIVNIVISTIIVMRLLNILRLCSLFRWHYTKDKTDANDVLSACTFQVLIYIVWILMNVMVIVLKLISINFAYRSHTLVKKLTKRSKRRRKRDH